ncbi:YdcH family protein [Phenylobacterium montanum]|uniref:DUF465 domain-containing protein n=1 Tax=Phenylobacterium montanum TaxID=2823693 RepID=A0A975ITB2_9CAUL|nr:DUF465 domain-containing protein [Caulobacter sp. S6]QUD86598.1 DUF465 domain-containing protein [Caulobacter sp. S6]
MFDDNDLAANDDAILMRIADLRQQHKDLDDAVVALSLGPQPDQLQIARLKRQKLVLRDKIAELEDRLTPDIIA